MIEMRDTKKNVWKMKKKNWKEKHPQKTVWKEEK